VIEAEGWEFSKTVRSLDQFIQKWKDYLYKFWNTRLF
jgi:hypothetical protein